MEGCSRLKVMKDFAQFIDEGLKELECALSSVDTLMPSEDCHQQSLELMQGIFEEVKALEEHSFEMKSKLQAMVASARNDNQKAAEKNQRIESDLLEIVETLKKYGFDSSAMPKFDPNAPAEVENSSTCKDVSGTEDSNMELEDQEEKNDVTLSFRDVVQLSESMTDVEITPLVLSSKSYSKAYASSVASPIVTPHLKPMKTFSGVTPKSVHLYSDSSFLNRCDVTDNSEKTSPKPTKVLVKPKCPVLSKVTYEVLGQEPPPEFYDEQNVKEK